MEQEILNDEAVAFLSSLHRTFQKTRLQLLEERKKRHKKIQEGQSLDFLEETASIRNDPSWKVAPPPKDVEKRWVEITGPTDPKMMINALNSSADVFMADFEDANSPTWANMIEGQANVRKAFLKTLEYTSPEGKTYRLNETTACLMVRPRGWHLEEKHFLVDGERMSASLFDAGLFLFHNAKNPNLYLYLPKLESYLEARLWNDVFSFIENKLHLPKNTIRVTVLIETILAAFEMEEILFELKIRILGLNAGRWDYLFSIIKTFPHYILPDRGQITMNSSFMKAYATCLIQTCHRRGAHAMGGMAALIPSRKDVALNEMALAKVKEDKIRESKEGFDGSWVAHPDLVPLVHDVFQKELSNQPSQKEKMPTNEISPQEMLDFSIPEGTITKHGIQMNITISLQYMTAWLQGRGALGLFNLMEDLATAEISRCQLWQWVQNQILTKENYLRLADGETKEFFVARKLLDQLVFSRECPEFLSLIAYELL